MIKISNLTKKYKSKSNDTFKALDEINLVLPDRGMVFVIGKSGSGKSTLLNLVGGLDSFDGGDIVVFGNSLASFSPSEYDAYRSDVIGFIFQDYHLIEELTVLENITLFGTGEIDTELLDRVLLTTGIEDLLSRYPRELSGGQKQRVAIARAIIKEPKILLCDEPTGNLDRKTSVQILELLKELSKDKLVLLVSHNLGEAEQYADRIIELADGRIVGDTSRSDTYSDDLLIENGTLRIPYHTRLADDEIERINNAISSGEVKNVVQNGSGFVETCVEYSSAELAIRSKRISPRNVLRLFCNFLFTKKAQTLVAILLSAVMVCVFAVMQSFVAFDASSALSQSLESTDPLLVIERDYSSFPKAIYDDLSVFDSENTYMLYPQTLWTNNPHPTSWDTSDMLSDEINLEDFYAHETYGLLICDEKYLANRFAVGGELTLLAGSLDGAFGTEILITDYFADSIIKHEEAYKLNRYLSYEDIVSADAFCPVEVNYAAKICGIIYTGYQEKYSKYIELFEEYRDDPEMEYSDLREMLKVDTGYIDLVDDIKTNLAVSYSFNDDYAKDIDFSETSLVRTIDLFFGIGEAEVLATGLTYASVLQRNPIDINAFSDDEIGLPPKLVNELLGTELGGATGMIPEDSRIKVRITRYEDNNAKKGVVYTEEFTLAAITNHVVMTDNAMKKFQVMDWIPTRVYFDSPSDVDSIIGFLNDTDYHLVSVKQEKLKELNDIIITFRELFFFMQMIIATLISLYLVNYGTRSIKQNNYQIGVIKALGGSMRDVSVIFLTKTFIVGSVISIISAVASLSVLSFSDDILLMSIEKFSGISLDGLTIIRVIPEFIIINALVVIGISIVSAALTSLALVRIKPVSIIKARE